MISFNYMDCLEKSTITALSMGAMTRMVMSENPYVLIPVINRVVPIWLFGGVVGFIASHINDIVHNFVKSEVHLREKATNEEAMLIAAIVGAGTFTGSLYLINSGYVNGIGLGACVGIGAAGELIGSWLFNLIRG